MSSTNHTITISASASLYDNVGAVMELYMNNTLMGSVLVNNTNPEQFSFVVPFENNEIPQFSIAFTNDAYSSQQDRNLQISAMTLDEVLIYPNDSNDHVLENVYFDKGSGLAARDHQDIYKADFLLPHNGSLNFSVNYDALIQRSQNEQTMHTISGTAGNDTLYETANDDVMMGGAGTNTFILGDIPAPENGYVYAGKNIIKYSQTSASGVRSYDTSVIHHDTVDMNHIHGASFQRDGNDLVITGFPAANIPYEISTASTYRIEYYFDSHQPVSKIVYGNRDLSVADMNKLTSTYGQSFIGTQGNDTLYAYSENNDATLIAHGREGNDIIAGYQTAYGDQGNDSLYNASVAYGGSGNDSYYYDWSSTNLADDKSTLYESDNTKGNLDTLILRETQTDQLWFARSGNNLIVSAIGTQHQVTIQDWYLGSAHHIEQIKALGSDQQPEAYKTLTDTGVNKLVAAMATMTPPPAGQTSLPASDLAHLSTVLAASWK
jgi:Ca2+-binding RTX toxin-like protein